MAKKVAAAEQPTQTVNKSQAVRDYLKAHRKATPKMIAEALKAEGIDISPQVISTIKFNMRKKKKAKKRAAGTATASKATNGRADDISLSVLVETTKLVNKLGGIENAKAVLAVLSGLK